MKPHLGAFPLKILGLKEQPNAYMYFYGPSKTQYNFKKYICNNYGHPTRKN